MLLSNRIAQRVCWQSACLVAFGFCALGVRAEAAISGSYALAHVIVVDVKHGQLQPDMTVVIAGERIASIQKSSATAVSKDMHVVDARDKYLIPGLWDMHAHVFMDGHLDDDLSLYIANGVTGLRDTGGLWKFIDPFLKQRAHGKVGSSRLAIPRIETAGAIIDGSPAYSDETMTSVATPDQGREAVKASKRRGADFVKVYSYLDRPTFLAIADEAKRQRMALAGHVPYAVDVATASDAGQRSLEHADGILLAASTREDEDRKEVLRQAPRLRGGEMEKFELYYIYAHYLPMKSYSADKAASLYRRFVQNGTWVCPTLIADKVALVQDEDSVLPEDGARYVSESRVRSWKQFMNEIAWSAANAPSVKQVYHRLLDLTGELNRAGVGLLAGTDIGVPYLVPGFSLHRELALLVAAGLSPLQSLQAATLNPARYFGKEQDLGSVEQGKIADLVLLDANPLVDIHHTSSVRAVIANGIYSSRAALDARLRVVEANSKSSR